MGAVKDAYLRMLDALEDQGKTDRATANLVLTDEQLVQLAMRLGGVDLLGETVDRATLMDLRDAYDTGRRPDLIDFYQVAHSLGDLGVRAHVLHTSGGSATLYAGDPDDRYDQDDRRRWPVSLGPGDWSGTDATGLVDEISYGPPTDDIGHQIEPGDTPADIAAAIAALLEDVPTLTGADGERPR